MGTPEISWSDAHRLRVGACDFYCNYPLREVPDGHIPVMKPRFIIDEYAKLTTSGARRHIVELGIDRGGGAALIRELFAPQKLVAVELAERPAVALDRYIAERSLEEVVRPYYGVDQADRARLSQILDDEFGDEPIDLVVDDASHLYAESVASFEVLLPRVRPGGLYVIEDWTWEHLIAGGMRRARLAGGDEAKTMATKIKAEVERRAAGGETAPVPFTQMIIELVLARAGGDVISSLSIGPAWVVVERGPGTLDRESFRLSDLYRDHFGQIPARA